MYTLLSLLSYMYFGDRLFIISAGLSLSHSLYLPSLPLFFSIPLSPLHTIINSRTNMCTCKYIHYTIDVHCINSFTYKCTCTGFPFSHSWSSSVVFCSTTLSSATIFICRLPTCAWTAASFLFMISLKAPHSPSTLST